MYSDKADYTFIPNPGINEPNDLEPSHKMNISRVLGYKQGVWPDQYQHLDTGKPLVQEMIDLTIQKHVGDDRWLDFSREAARRQFRFQTKFVRAHALPEFYDREIDLSVFLDVGSEFGYNTKEALRFWSLHSIAHVKRREIMMDCFLKKQANLDCNKEERNFAIRKRAEIVEAQRKAKQPRVTTPEEPAEEELDAHDPEPVEVDEVTVEPRIYLQVIKASA